MMNDMTWNDVCGYLDVNSKLVEEKKEIIKRELKSTKIINLFSLFNDLEIRNVTLEEDFTHPTFKNFFNKISEFMAIQEALQNMIIDKEILPIVYNYPISTELTINIKHKKQVLGGTHISDSIMEIPRLIYNSFVIVPSKIN